MKLAARMRTPEGQMALIAITLLGSVPLAIALGSSTSFFEGYVRERHLSATADRERASARLLSGETLAGRELELVYEEAFAARGDEALAHALAERAPQWFLDRIERTLVGGDLGQRRRALAMLAASGAPSRQMLEGVLARARRMGPDAIIPDLERALASRAR